MKSFEFKIYGSRDQFAKIDEQIRISQFIRNKCIAKWIENYNRPKDDRDSITRFSLNKYSTVVSREFLFCKKLDANARQAAAERAWISISSFYRNCKNNVSGKKGFPKFKKDSNSVEYKKQGWRLSGDILNISNKNWPSKNDIGNLKIRGDDRLFKENKKLIKRMRIVKKSECYFVAFVVDVDDSEHCIKTNKEIGMDLGIASFCTFSDGTKSENPRYYRKSEKRLQKLHRKMSLKKKGSNNRNKARIRLARKHFQVANQRKDHAVKLARCVMKSNDFVACEDLKVANMVKNRSLAKSISDAGWSTFVRYLEYYSKKFNKTLIKVDPRNTSQMCSACGVFPEVKKKLSDRVHICKCGLSICRDTNAAINILNLGENTAGYAGIHAWGDSTSTQPDASQVEQVESLNQESMKNAKLEPQ